MEHSAAQVMLCSKNNLLHTHNKSWTHWPRTKCHILSYICFHRTTLPANDCSLNTYVSFLAKLRMGHSTTPEVFPMHTPNRCRPLILSIAPTKDKKLHSFKPHTSSSNGMWYHRTTQCASKWLLPNGCLTIIFPLEVSSLNDVYSLICYNN